MLNLNHLPIFDLELSHKLAGQKHHLMLDLFNLLIKTLPKDSNTINKLYNEKNYSALQQHIHRLHGALCYCGVPRLKALIEHVELQLKNNLLENLSSLIGQVNQEIGALLKYHADSPNPISGRSSE